MLKTVKKILPFILLAIIIAISYINYNQAKIIENDPISVIPSKTSIIIKINKPNKLGYYLNKNTIWNKLENIPAINIISNEINNIEKFYKSSKIKNTPLYISILQDGASELGYLLSSELKEKDKEIILETFNLKSLDAKKFKYDNSIIYKLNIDTSTFFLSVIDEIICLSSSKTILEDAINSHYSEFNLMNNEKFTSLYSTVNKNNQINIIFNINNLLDLSTKISAIQKPGFKFSEWVATDFTISDNLILLNGVSNLSEKINNYTDIFNKQKSNNINISKIIPENVRYLKALSFSNIKTLFKNNNKLLESHNEIWGNDKYQKKILSEFNFSYLEFLNQIDNEAGIFSCDYKNINNFIYLKSKESIHTFSLLQKLIDNNKSSSHLNYNINYLNDPFLASTIFSYPKFKQNANYFTVINDYFFFSDKVTSLEYLIENYISNNTLFESKYFNTFNNIIPSESNMFYYLNTNLLLDNINSYFHKDIVSQSEVDSLAKLTSISFQISNNNSNLLNNIALFYNSNYKEKIKEKWFIQLDTTARIKPQIIFNHKIKENAIVLQDNNKKIYYITDSEKYRWEKNIDQKIIGNISQGDFFKNQKKQMIFNTYDKLFMLDIYGKNVDKFPIKLKENTTLGHSIFDYNKVKKYRILIPTINNNILNLDKNGKSVFGWKYQNDNSQITSDLEHFKISNKDFILFSTRTDVKLLAINGSERFSFKTSLINSSLSRNNNGNLYGITDDFKLWQADINGLSTFINLPGIDSLSHLTINRVNNNIIYSTGEKIKILDINYQEILKYDFDSQVENIYYYKEYLIVKTKENIYLLKDYKIVEGTPIKSDKNYTICNLNSSNKINIIIIRNKVLYNYELK